MSLPRGGIQKEPPSVPPEGHKTIVEATAAMIYKKEAEVFYNPAQVLNRDLSCVVLRHFDKIRRSELTPGKTARLIKRRMALAGVPNEEIQKFVPKDAEAPGMRVLEALAATGLRSIRYWHEVPGIDTILVNDLEEAAVEAIKRNLEYNGVDTSKVVPNRGDARMVMYDNLAPHKQFDVVDLDPYGTATPFMDAAVQCISDGGLMAVTCTDMGTLAGNNTHACFGKYGAIPIKMRSCHEMALRMVLGCLERHANTYGKSIDPQLSLSVDFYVRMFVRVHSSKSKVLKSAERFGIVQYCHACNAHQVQPVGRKHKKAEFSIAAQASMWEKCPVCGSSTVISGPVYSGPLHNKEFVNGVLDTLTKEGVQGERAPGAAVVERKLPEADAGSNTYKTVESSRDRLRGLIGVVASEIDAPFYYVLDSMCHQAKLITLKSTMVTNAIENAGYTWSRTHCNKDGIKTDAPPEVLWDILRCYERTTPVAEKHKKDPKTLAHNLFSKPPKLEADFSRPSGERRSKRKAMFMVNPTDHWGPLSKATGKVHSTGDKDKVSGGGGGGGGGGGSGVTDEEKSETVAAETGDAKRARSDA